MNNFARGIYPMLYAFFNADGSLDLSAIQAQVRAAVNGGAHGLAVLGLGTEVSKLTAQERMSVIDGVASELNGRLPLCVTVAEGTAPDAVRAARYAQDAGAAFIILQPPPKPGAAESEQIAFFGAVADQITVPVAIQNAPQYLGSGLTLAGITALAARHPNVSVIKAEGSALFVRDLMEATAGRMAIFNGRCGLELTDNLRAGCHGMIPGIDSFDVQARIFDLMQTGKAADEQEAEQLYAEILPLIVFIIQSLDSFLCYGKRVAAHRLGLGAVHDRAPALAPHPVGMEWAMRMAAKLGPLAT